MKKYEQEIFGGERALFGSFDLVLNNCVFKDGESPLKECGNLDISNCLFQWKYPLWYCRDVKVSDCVLYENARAGVWYTEDITVKDTVIEAPKTFRRSKNITIENVSFHSAEETLWTCDGVRLKNVTVSKGTYFAMNCKNAEIDGLILDGNYSFDGAENVVIKNSKLITKDAFWNSKNITVYDSFISGEYLGWNSEDLTLVNCTVESLQGMCYIKNLKMINCRLINTTLAFEYSDVEADIKGAVSSVFNPGSGYIKADRIDELIVEEDKADKNKFRIICNNVVKTSDKPEWKR